MKIQRIRRLRGATEYARFLAQVAEKPLGVIRRVVGSPDHSGPVHVIYNGPGKKAVFVVETEHLRYSVYEVLDRTMIYPTEEDLFRLTSAG